MASRTPETWKSMVGTFEKSKTRTVERSNSELQFSEIRNPKIRISKIWTFGNRLLYHRNLEVLNPVTWNSKTLILNYRIFESSIIRTAKSSNGELGIPNFENSRFELLDFRKLNHTNSEIWKWGIRSSEIRKFGFRKIDNPTNRKPDFENWEFGHSKPERVNSVCENQKMRTSNIEI